MIKIFLVEDEVVIRNGIKKSIDWEKEGYEFAGEASDGELAYPLIKKAQPDILITDIKMPFMDGLELSKLVKQEFPKIKIIVLSGYNEFDYAKQAIKIGITEYLLKPITPAKLLEAIKGVAAKITKEKEQQVLYEQYKQEMLENQNLDKQLFFNDLVSREFSVSEMEERAQKLDLQLMATDYNVVLLSILKQGEVINTYSEDIVEIVESLETMVEELPYVYMFDRVGDGWCFLVLGEFANNIEMMRQSMVDRIVKIIELYDAFEYFVAIGKPVRRLRELPESYREASRVFSYRYLGEGNQVISYVEFESTSYRREKNEEFSVQNIGKIDRTLLEKFLKSGREEDTENFIMNYFKELGESNMKSMMFRQYIAMDVYIGAVTFAENLGISKEQITETFGELQELSGQISSQDNTEKYAIHILEKALRLRDNVASQKYNQLIGDAIQYMKENYANEDITLKSVAASVNISPSYFSSIFRQEVGQTFIEYLTEIRMEKAKELLMCTNKKTTEIGFEVGYKEPHYFSYIFKKTQLCSPKEFRNRG